jgi:tetratricopeptide (TPR) repeat protein
MRRPSVSVPCAANLVAWLSLVAPALASPQRPDLLPLERTALAASANGDYAAAAAALLDLAEVSAQDAASSTVGAARVEAWCTKAAALLTGVPADAPAGTTSIARLDRLRASPLATARPLLADRVGTALLELAGRLGRPDAAARAASLGALVDFALVGPFDNERGAGYARALPPERGLDLDAEFAGKRRPVRWRRLPPAPGDGALRLEAIVHPHEQSLVYLAAAVRVPAATHAVLELGTTGAFRVFCNGVEAGARDVRRELAYDQDAIPLALAAGANLLVLKLCHQEGSEFAYCARLRAPDGRPLAGFESSADDEALRAAAATTAVAPAPGGGTPPDVDLGGRTALPIDAAAGADALRAAWLWAARAADGDLDRRDRRAALRAAEALPDTAEAHLLVAFAHRSIGRAAADRDANERRRAIERALACAPRHVGALVLLGTLLYQESRLRQDALDLAARALAVDPAFAPAILLRADCHRDAGLEIMAAPAVVRAAEAKDATTSLLRRAADLLGADETRRELGLRMRVLERGGDADDRTAAAACLARTGRRAEAIALLEEAIARDPFARQARRRLADLHMAGGDARSAVRTLEAWLAIAPDDAEMLVLASACWRRLAAADDSAAAQQRALLDEALELEPNRRDDERYRDFLGAADTADAAAFHAPWQVDGEALVRTDGAPPADAAQKLDAVHWLLRQRVVRANGNGTTSDYLHVVVRILSVEGARRFATFRLPHFAGEQRARLLHCAIRRDDGTVLQPPLRGASVALSELRPGDVVDLAGRVDDLAPTFFGDYFGLLHHFAAGDGSPVRRSELVVVADPGRTYRWQAANGAPEPERSTQPGAALVFRWSSANCRARRPSRTARSAASTNRSSA